MSELTKFRILVIDDDRLSLAMVSDALQQGGVEIIAVDDAEDGFSTFLRLRPHIVLLDLFMPNVTGMEMLERMMQADPGADIILITGQYSTDLAVEAIKKGACDYLTKPLDIGILRNRVATLLREAEVRRKTLRLEEEMVDACQFEGIVGRSPLMLEVFAKIRRVAPHFKSVLVTGATGTGKELVARALHRLSSAQKDRFVECNCSALVESLVESELFGYVRGAFTGATQDKAGLVEAADRGTLFLDEIGDLPLGMQAKLLRVLQDHQVRRVGSVSTREVDVRIIAATNRNLSAMVREGTFREDLFYRLSMVEVVLPRLVDRREDIPLLQRHFLAKYAEEFQRPISGLTRRAQSRIARYPWPGNVRELENAIGNACMMTEGKFIDIHDLPERLREVPEGCTSTEDDLCSLAEAERRHVMHVLERVGGNKLKAARILGVGRNTIYKMVVKSKTLLGASLEETSEKDGIHAVDEPLRAVGGTLRTRSMGLNRG